jgi:hypothetical protein
MLVPSFFVAALPANDGLAITPGLLVLPGMPRFQLAAHGGVVVAVVVSDMEVCVALSRYVFWFTHYA